MATDPWTQRFQDIDKLQQQPAAPATTTAAPTAAPATVTPEASTVAPSADPYSLPGHEAATAVVAGMRDLAGNVVRNLGFTPTPFDPESARIAAAHPYWRTAGGLLAGGVVAPVVAMATPEIGGVYGTAALSGGAANLLTGDPNQPWWERAGIGAGLGAGFAGLGSRIGSWFGAGTAPASQQIADAAQLAQQAGIDLNIANLPLTGAAAAARGAPATVPQIQQINRAFGRLLGQDARLPGGQDVTDFSPQTLQGIKSDLGNQISTAASRGQITATPQFASDLNSVVQAARDPTSMLDPTAQRAIEAQVKKISDALTAGNGTLSGAQFDNLTGAGSKLHDWVGSDDANFARVAQQLDSTLRNGFQASSPAGAYGDWVNARTLYRMTMGIEKNLVAGTGNINPATIYNSLLNRFGDLKGVPASTANVVGQAGELANAVRTLFGGGPSTTAAAAPSLLKSIGAHIGIGGVPAVASAVASGNLANPENYLSPAGIAGLGVAGTDLLGQWAGQRLQQTPWFVNQLIRRGGAPIPNPLVSPFATTLGTVEFPQRRFAP